ncbi:MAG: DUF1844 domain-containing protein [candidate division NC10 bacterium]|nr:DUF1844 domain-containing protein [candidate division NC10 bacterium]
MPDEAPGKEKEPSFRVTDRRRVGAEGPRETATPDEAHPEARPDPQSPESEAPPPEDLTLPDLVRLFVAELQMRALIDMGLIPNPATRLVAKDLPQARLAINCVAALIEHLSPLAPPAERDALQQVVTELRLHFVRQSGT